jgi:hypothetical protein
MTIATKKGLISVLSTIALFSIIAKAEPAQYIALTGGTNGFGAKYSFLIGPMSFDFGIPLYFRQGEEKWSDTTEEKDEFHFNPYLSANLKIIKKARASFSIGIAWVLDAASTSYRLSVKNPDTLIEKSFDIGYESTVCPVIEYAQSGKNNNRLFGAQLYPIKFHPGYKKGYSIEIGIQLNYFFKRIIREGNTESTIPQDVPK